jgi:hypothetical protein
MNCNGPNAMDMSRGEIRKSIPASAWDIGSEYKWDTQATRDPSTVNKCG